MKQTAIPTFVLLSLFSVSAAAQSEDDWFEQAPAETAAEEPAAEPEPEPEPERAKKPEAAPAAAKPTQAAPASAKSDDPVRDQAIEKKERNPSAHRHDGFYLRMSIGGGSLAARGDRYDSSYSNRQEYTFEGNAMSFDIMVGGTLLPGLAVGGAYQGSYAAQANYSEQQDGDAGMSFGMIGPFIDIFPDPHGGFHLGGMLGPAATVAYDDRYEETAAAVGFGGSVWVGYDFWISNQWSLGAVLRASAAQVETPASRELEQLERDRLGVGSVALMVTALYH
jgi:hypothetical protein